MVASVAFALASLPAGSLLALLWVLVRALGVSLGVPVSVKDTNSASMPHKCDLGFETPGDKM